MAIKNEKNFLKGRKELVLLRMCRNWNHYTLWREFKMMQICEKVWQILKRLNIELPCDQAITSRHILQRIESGVSSRYLTTFIAALFPITWSRNNPTVDKRKVIYTYNGISCIVLCQVAPVVSDSLLPYGLKPARLLCPWDSPGKNTGMGCHTLLQEIFLTQGLNPHLLSVLHWQVGSYH